MGTVKIPGYGWRKQHPDHRDHLYHENNTILSAEELSPTGGLSHSEQPSIWNQLQLGTCVPHGSRRGLMTEAMQQNIAMPLTSRLWVYAYGRVMESTDLSQDSGMEVRDAIKVLATNGAPDEKDWPYSDANPGPFQKMPPASLKAEALQNLAVQYQSIVVNSPGAPMRTALSRKKAIIFGFMVPDYFEDSSVWDPSSGQPLPVPDLSKPVNWIGGHCVCATYYNFSGKFISTPSTNRSVRPYFECPNSWDTGWGMDGYFNMDADWFTPRPNGALASDLWIINLVK